VTSSGVFDREFGVLSAEFCDIGGDVWRVDEASEERLYLVDNGFLIVGEGAGGCNHAVDERQDFNRPATRRIGYFEYGHGAGLRSVECRDAT
jgi:hypothetical protein